MTPMKTTRSSGSSQAREDTGIFPTSSNFNAHTQSWDSAMGDVIKDPAKRNQIRQNSSVF